MSEVEEKLIAILKSLKVPSKGFFTVLQCMKCGERDMRYTLTVGDELFYYCEVCIEPIKRIIKKVLT